MMVKTIGPSAPAPNPWITRNAINCGMLRESPESIDPTLNINNPNNNTRRRPIKSASLP